MAKISEIYAFLNQSFPFCDAEKWDNSGYLVESDCEVKKIIVSLDATCKVVNEAIDKKAELIITHHPVIFSPISALSLSNPAVLAVKNSVGIISAHTNYDVSSLGADALLEKTLVNAFGFTDVKILDITDRDKNIGFGRIGIIPEAKTADEFAKDLKTLFNADSIRYTACEKPIKKVAFCCGGGSSYIEKAIALGCDAYITSDVKHSSYISAENAGMALFTPTHYQMEKPAMTNIVKVLSDKFPEIEILESEFESEPSKAV